VDNISRKYASTKHKRTRQVIATLVSGRILKKYKLKKRIQENGGPAAVGLVLAGRRVKVFKEKVCSGEGTREASSQSAGRIDSTGTNRRGFPWVQPLIRITEGLCLAVVFLSNMKSLPNPTM
jgi:hypothetical protein